MANSARRRALHRRRLPGGRPAGPGRSGDGSPLLRPGRPAPQAELGRDHRGSRGCCRRCRAAARHRRTRRRRRTVRPAGRRRAAPPSTRWSPTKPCCGRPSPTPGWGWFSWGRIRCGRPSASTRAPVTRPWSSSSPPAAPGEAGAAMMTSTASIQVNLDAGPQDGWAARVRLAHALGPDHDRDRRQLADAGRRVHRLGRPPGSGCGARWTRRAAGPSWAPAATTPAPTGRATR